MLNLRLLVIIFVTLVLVGFCQRVVEEVGADHFEYLPGLPTPIINQIAQAQTINWCVNDAASRYPNFVAQLEDVQDQYADRVGIDFERVAYGSPATTGCQIQHDMVDPHRCGGCAAWIFYQSWPVKVEYKQALGYFDWRSAQGHELGHGLLGLHEQYIDSGSQIQCVPRPETVMSCGPPHVKYPQPRDVELGCAVIGTSWCGAVQEPGENVFDPERNAWVAPNGNLYWLNYGVWEWKDCTSWQGRQNNRLTLFVGAPVYMPAGQSVYVHGDGWVQAPPC